MRIYHVPQHAPHPGVWTPQQTAVPLHFAQIPNTIMVIWDQNESLFYGLRYTTSATGPMSDLIDPVPHPDEAKSYNFALLTARVTSIDRFT